MKKISYPTSKIGPLLHFQEILIFFEVPKKFEKQKYHEIIN
jgi:hypothetical protein